MAVMEFMTPQWRSLANMAGLMGKIYKITFWKHIFNFKSRSVKNILHVYVPFRRGNNPIEYSRLFHSAMEDVVPCYSVSVYPHHSNLLVIKISSKLCFELK